MSIRAVLKHGVIQPLDPLPSAWADGKELVIEEPEANRPPGELDQWVQDLDAATAQIPAEEHSRLLQALDEIEKESKESVRRQWGIS